MAKIKFAGRHGFKGFFTATKNNAERDTGTDKPRFMKQQYATRKL